MLQRQSFASDTSSDQSKGALYNLTGRATILRDKPYRGSVFYDHLNPTLSVSPGQVLTQQNTRYGFDMSILGPVTPVPVYVDATRTHSQGRGVDRIIEDMLDRLNFKATRSFGALGATQVQYQSTKQASISGSDYTITVVGLETRLQRLIGGNIVDGQEVLVDYSYDVGGTYAYAQSDQTLNINWSLRNYVSVYLRYIESTPRLTSGSPTFQLNTVRGSLYGVRADMPLKTPFESSVGGSFESEDRRETISPYTRVASDVYVQSEDPFFGSGNGKFLVMSNQGSALCQTCHLKNYWSQSDHRLSTKTWNGSGTNPWPHTSWTTVSANACESCHRPHAAGGKKWNLNTAVEENNCYPCHNGNVAVKNVQSEFAKSSIHPVAATTGVHDPIESAVAQSRHVECVDCHNPHASNATAGTLPGSLIGVRGIDINGAAINPATAEYQICFRCHADSPGQPAPLIARQIAQSNTRLEFSTLNPSYHPVAGPGKSANVPSLLAPWTISSIVKCEDCHNNNAGPGAGGTGPNGPHGSTNVRLLERPYATNSTPNAGDICYKCHRQSTVTSESPHNRSEHLRYGCKACHDPHGISGTQGNATFNSRLINLSTTDNTPVGTGAAAKLYVNTVTRQCYLNCHGEAHNGRSY